MLGLSNQRHDLGQLRGTRGRNATRRENSGLKLTLKNISLGSVLKGGILIDLEENVCSVDSSH
jgi:hypothetical protein